jgi:hypothetical protein
MAYLQSELAKCHYTYCNTILNNYQNGKITIETFLHIYYSSIVPLSRHYDFPISENIKYAIDTLEGNA